MGLSCGLKLLNLHSLFIPKFIPSFSVEAFKKIIDFYILIVASTHERHIILKDNYKIIIILAFPIHKKESKSQEMHDIGNAHIISLHGYMQGKSYNNKRLSLAASRLKKVPIDA